MSLLRIFLSQADGALASWQAGQIAPGFTGFALMLKAEDGAAVAAAFAFRDRCLAAGLECVVGFRIAETFKHIANWCERRFWDESTATANLIYAAGGRVLPLDDESYGYTVNKIPTKADLATIGRTPAHLRDAMTPFLAALEKFDKVLIHPGNVEDECIAAIYDRIGAKLELWNERFDLTLQIMRDPHKAEHFALGLAQNRARQRRRFPLVTIREGVHDWFFRAIGNEARRSWMDAFGSLDPWVLIEHQHIDEHLFGSLAYYNAIHLGRGNQPAHAWAFAGARPDLKLVSMSDLKLEIKRASTAPETQSTVLSSLGYRLTDSRYGMATRALTQVATAPFTVVFDGEVSTQLEPEIAYVNGNPTVVLATLKGSRMRPVIGESQSNVDSWAVVHDGSQLFLRLAAMAPGGAHEFFKLGFFERGRFAISRLANRTWVYTAPDGSEVAITPTRAVRIGGGHLYVGIAVSSAGTASIGLHEGLVIGRPEIHLTETTAEERAAIVAQPYPRE